ncbi:hypothetical protein [Methylomagnum ishizawai]|uniref:hypothetical protein n=1 Tax=Methylomagnum ishizawai TaxID=1760988 RepID=UPI001C323AB2|nr:hypothetical protein [Methylomagnum ishizawai]BBL76332.1 hypothetical protein MishRS11D_34300 [Methylomagnum ishizawai]
MNDMLIRMAVAAVGLGAAANALATGFVTLPATGLAVPGGTSAYASCNTTGDFGSNPNGSTPPTTKANNTCAIFRADDNTPPLAGYVRKASVTRNIVMKNGYTNNTSVTVGTVIDEVWRSGTSCIYAAKIRLDNVDYDRRSASPGKQYFEINDFLRAGFKNRGPVAAAYHFSKSQPAADDVLYRAGLTYTSVVHEPGDPAQPLTKFAPISPNWVDFTSDVNFLDPDGSSVRDSSWFFVRSACTSAAPAELAGALRFRQMGQEDQPLIEVSIPGFAPANANTNP